MIFFQYRFARSATLEDLKNKGLVVELPRVLLPEASRRLLYTIAFESNNPGLFDARRVAVGGVSLARRVAPRSP